MHLQKCGKSYNYSTSHVGVNAGILLMHACMMSTCFFQNAADDIETWRLENMQQRMEGQARRRCCTKG